MVNLLADFGKNQSLTPKCQEVASKQYKLFELKPFIPACLWACIIFVLSTIPSIQMPGRFIAPDKLGHLVVYGILNWLIFRALAKRQTFTTKNAILATLFVTGFGIAMEFVQWAFFPNRFFEVWDMLANFTGAILSYFAFTFYITKK